MIKSIWSRIFTWNGFFLFLCSVGCICNIYLIIYDYLQFNFIVLVEMDVPDVIPLPDIVLCIPVFYLINVTKLTSQHPQIMGELRVKNTNELKQKYDSDPFELGSEIIAKFTIKQITSFIYKPEELIQLYGSLGKSNIKYPNVCLLQGIYKSFSYCIVWHCSRKDSVMRRSDKLITGNHYDLFIAKLETNFVPNATQYSVGLIEPNTLPWGNSLKLINIDFPKHARFFAFSYTIFTLKSLPPPYPTKCYNYKLNGYYNAAHKKDYCLSTLTLNRLGVLSPNSLASPNLDHRLGDVTLIRSANNLSFNAEIKKIGHYCDKLTSRPNCYERYFFLVNYDKSDYYDKDGAFIRLDEISEPITSIAKEPKTSFTECLIMIGSILGIWFGFAVASHIPKILSMTSKYLSKSRVDPRFYLKSKF